MRLAYLLSYLKITMFNAFKIYADHRYSIF